MLTSVEMQNTCCFFGHRDIQESEELKQQLCAIIERLITDEKTDTFLFGSKSSFDRLCLRLVSEFKERYPYIKRIYVRAEYQFISDSYSAYLLRQLNIVTIQNELSVQGERRM